MSDDLTAEELERLEAALAVCWTTQWTLMAERDEAREAILAALPRLLAMARRCVEAEEKAAALQRFKDWVHAYLDTHGVPHHPPGTHGAEGCRIGDRMDWVMARVVELEAAAGRYERERGAAGQP